MSRASDQGTCSQALLYPTSTVKSYVLLSVCLTAQQTFKFLVRVGHVLNCCPIYIPPRSTQRAPLWSRAFPRHEH